jgi:hypothetical protein
VAALAIAPAVLQVVVRRQLVPGARQLLQVGRGHARQRTHGGGVQHGVAALAQHGQVEIGGGERRQKHDEGKASDAPRIIAGALTPAHALP